MLKGCFFIPVGPSDIDRCMYTVRSIRKCCSAYHIYLLIDMKPEAFGSTQVHGGDVDIIYSQYPSGGHWGKIWQLQNEGMKRALLRNDLEDDAVFVKIDADAMVVRPGLLERAQELFRNNPRCGLLGQVHKNISWEPLHNKGWVNYFKNRITPIGLVKAFVLMCLHHGLGEGLRENWRLAFKIKTLINKAVANGYSPGKFAIGGAYILRAQTVRKLYIEGWLDGSPFKWWPRPEEDVIMTPHVFAVGYTAEDDVEKNGIFGICGKEPWVHPIDLVNRGHYIIHSLKYGVTLSSPQMSEKELVELILSRH